MLETNTAWVDIPLNEIFLAILRMYIQYFAQNLNFQVTATKPYQAFTAPAIAISLCAQVAGCRRAFVLKLK